MVYDHMVKVNGQYYRAGEDVPEIDYTAGDENSLPFSDDDITFETQGDKKYTKTDINRMSVSELRKMALSTGVEDPDEMTGTELKEYLISLFGL